MPRAPYFTPSLPPPRPWSGVRPDITLASRYEFKYVIDPTLVGALRQFIQPFMRPDPFASLRQGHRYPICSLYLDSSDLCLYQQTVNGSHSRFKLRIRTYSDDENRAVFFEVKQKHNNIVQKRRARLSHEQAQRLLDDLSSSRLTGLPQSLLADIEFFHHNVRLTEARPVVKVKYVREAYESRAGDPVRVTLDTELCHAVTLDRDISHAQGRWVHTPVSGVILELKFTNRFPVWMTEMVRFFALKQRSVPKYIMSIDHMLLGGRESVLALGGFTLPPRRV